MRFSLVRPSLFLCLWAEDTIVTGAPNTLTGWTMDGWMGLNLRSGRLGAGAGALLLAGSPLPLMLCSHLP